MRRSRLLIMIRKMTIIRKVGEAGRLYYYILIIVCCASTQNKAYIPMVISYAFQGVIYMYA